MTRKKKPAREIERILTRHPVNKAGFRIEKSKYDVVRNAILNGLRGSAPLTHTELDAKTRYLLGPDFKGSVGWYTEVVKLDLEARRKVFRSQIKPTVYSLTPETRRPKGNPAGLKK